MSVLSKKLKKSLGEMAPQFEEIAAVVHARLDSEITSSMKSSLEEGRSKLNVLLKEEFGVSGVSRADKYIRPFLIEVFDSFINSESKKVKSNLIKSLDNEEQKENQPMSATKAAKLVTLAYKAHKRGAVSSARDIFTLAMESEDAPELMEDINEMDEIDEDVSEEELMAELEDLVDEDEDEGEDEDVDVDVDVAEDVVESMEDEDEDEGEADEGEADEDAAEDEDEDDEYSEMSESQLRKLKSLANVITANRKPAVSRLGRQLMRKVRAARIKKVRV